MISQEITVRAQFHSPCWRSCTQRHHCTCIEENARQRHYTEQTKSRNSPGNRRTTKTTGKRNHTRAQKKPEFGQSSIGRTMVWYAKRMGLDAKASTMRIENQRYSEHARTRNDVQDAQRGEAVHQNKLVELASRVDGHDQTVFQNAQHRILNRAPRCVAVRSIGETAAKTRQRQRVRCGPRFGFRVEYLQFHRVVEEEHALPPARNCQNAACSVQNRLHCAGEFVLIVLKHSRFVRERCQIRVQNRRGVHPSTQKGVAPQELRNGALLVACQQGTMDDSLLHS